MSNYGASGAPSILFKHFPLILIFKNITKLFYLSIYNLFFSKQISYLYGFIGGLKDSHYLLQNKKSLTLRQSKEIKLILRSYFDISNDNTWSGS